MWRWLDHFCIFIAFFYCPFKAVNTDCDVSKYSWSFMHIASSWYMTFYKSLLLFFWQGENSILLSRLSMLPERPASYNFRIISAPQYDSVYAILLNPWIPMTLLSRFPLRADNEPVKHFSLFLIWTIYWKRQLHISWFIEHVPSMCTCYQLYIFIWKQTLFMHVREFM